jgi:hypothetical protein
MLMAPRLTKNLLMLAVAHTDATGGALSSLSKKAHSDSAFFERLAAGEISFSVRKYDEIVVWFFRHWPDGVAWPAAVDVPTDKEANAIAAGRTS